MFNRKIIAFAAWLALSGSGIAGNVLNLNLGAGPNDNTGDSLRTAGGKINTAVNGIASCFNSATAPTSLMPYQCWFDTSTAPATLKYFDGTLWVAAAVLDTSGHSFASVGFVGGALAGNLPFPSLSAGAAATNIGSLSGDLTGTLPGPTIASGAVTSAKMASGAAAANVGALSGDLTGSLPTQTIAKVQGTSITGVTGTGKAVLSASPAFSGDIGVIGAGLTAVTAAQRAPAFVWQDCSGTLPAGRDCGLQVWIGPNPTATPAADSPVAATIVMTNGNNRGLGPKLITGLNVVTVQCGTAEGCTTGFVDSPSVVAELDGSNSNTYTAANRAFNATTGTYAKNILELYNSPAVNMLTNALSIWSTDSTGVAGIFTGIEMARVKDIGVRFVVNPVGGTDTGVYFGDSAIRDDSNSAVFARFGNFTHSGAMINVASGATFSGGFYRGSSSADTNVLFANIAAFNTALTIDSGISAGVIKQAIINLNDRGDPKWRILRETDNNFYIKNVVSGNNVFEFNGDTQLDPNAVTVAGLPTCNAGLKYGRRTVSDAAASPVYNAVAAGGGSVALPVFCDGTNWRNR